MSIELIHLRKLLQILYLPAGKQLSMLRVELRTDRAREEGTLSGGGDFYAPFWADVKSHIFGDIDIKESVSNRVSLNGRRDRLYPMLATGFLKWWDGERRWTNAPFISTRAPSTLFKASEVLSIKIDNMLVVKDANNVDRFIYPYFSEEPMLRDEPARIALWTLKRAFPALPQSSFRVLDVIRGRVFSFDRNPLEGEEALALFSRYDRLWEMNEDLILNNS